MGTLDAAVLEQATHRRAVQLFLQYAGPKPPPPGIGSVSQNAAMAHGAGRGNTSTDRHLLDDLNAETLYTNHLARMIRQQPDRRQP